MSFKNLCIICPKQSIVNFNLKKSFKNLFVVYQYENHLSLTMLFLETSIVLLLLLLFCVVLKNTIFMTSTKLIITLAILSWFQLIYLSCVLKYSSCFSSKSYCMQVQFSSISKLLTCMQSIDFISNPIFFYVISTIVL